MTAFSENRTLEDLRRRFEEVMVVCRTRVVDEEQRTALMQEIAALEQEIIARGGRLADSPEGAMRIMRELLEFISGSPETEDLMEDTGAVEDASDACAESSPNLGEMSLEDLVGRFVLLTRLEDEADGFEAADRIYWRIEDVICELEHRKGDLRSALLALYTHSDICVRYRAANATRPIAPALARSRLLAVDDPNWTFPKKGRRIPEMPAKYSVMSLQDLTERFLSLALEQDEALREDAIPRYNRLYPQLEAVVMAIQARENDMRCVLLPLLQHSSPQVRLKAAYAIEDVAPQEARVAFQQIVDHGEYPQKADALGALERMDGKRPLFR